MVGEGDFVNIALKLSHFNRKQMPSVFVIINVQSYWNKAQIYSFVYSKMPAMAWGRGQVEDGERKMNL